MKTFAGKTATIVLISMVLTGLLVWIAAPARPYFAQIFILGYGFILVVWQPLLLPGDLPLREAMVKKPMLAALSIFGLIGLFIVAIAQMLMIHSWVGS